MVVRRIKPYKRFPHLVFTDSINEESSESEILDHCKKSFLSSFQKLQFHNKAVRFQVVKGDLFETKSEAIAHCVSEDLKMGKGIAVEFVKRFGRVDELEKQNPKEGTVVYLERDEKVMRIIFYMITKQKYWHIPTYEKVWDSLLDMRSKCEELGIKSLGLPLIACGLDRLDWTIVEDMIQKAFWDLDIDITVYVKP